MGKSKLIIGFLAILLVLSVGYALFGENITIGGTAVAQASFDINMECEKGYHADLDTYYFSSSKGQGGYSDDICSVNGNNINLSASLKFPTANRVFTIKVTNNGSLDAIININDKNEIGTSSKKVCIDTNEDDEMQESECTISTQNEGNKFITGSVMYIKDAQGNIEFLKSSNAISVQNGKQVLTIKPDESVYLVYTLLWDSNTLAKFITTELTAEYVFAQPTVE